FPTDENSGEQLFTDVGSVYTSTIQFGRSGSDDLAFTVGTNTVTASHALKRNEWQYVAVTMDADGAVKIYRNGVAVGSGTLFLDQFAIYNAAYLARGESGQSFAGAMDEAAVYGSALSAARIQAHYDRRFYGTVNVDLYQGGTYVKSLA